MAKPKKYRNDEDRKRARREAARLKREQRKKDPTLRELDKKKEQLRYKERVKAGKIKLVADMSDRQKRRMRKQWRLHTKNCRMRRAVLANLDTPPDAPDYEDPVVPVVTPEAPAIQPGPSNRSGRRRRREKDRMKVYRDLAREQREKEKWKRSSEMYRKRWFRLQKEKEKLATPRTRAKLILKGRDKEQIRKKLVFGEVMKENLKVGYKGLKSVAAKQIFTKVVGGLLLKQYRQLMQAGEFLPPRAYKLNHSRRNIKSLRYERQMRLDAVQMRNEVRKFLEQDENSWMCPGKKDFIRRGKVKHQKRFLTNSLMNLHKTFCQETGKKISYASFASFRPYYIIAPKAADRETCLCVLHENLRLKLKALHEHKVIGFSNPNDTVSAVCCKEKTESCLNRTCNKCKLATIPVSAPFENKEIEFSQWQRKKETISTKGAVKCVTLTVKSPQKASVRDLYLQVDDELKTFFKHVKNIRHQQAMFRSLRTSDNKSGLNIHIDFSENYSCKYAQEPQAIHFGASRKQLTLHTGVAYTATSAPQSFCTVSEDLRHDAKAVTAHLVPILKELLGRFPATRHLNVMSDGPSSQYKNRTMFTVMGRILPALFPQIQSLTWNYSEKGHGKGAADGVGGVLKRSADRIVAHQNDIVDVSSFLKLLKEACPGVFLTLVSHEDIGEMDNVIAQATLISTVKGSNQVHQVTWNKVDQILHFNDLSCLLCQPGKKCLHYAVTCVRLPISAQQQPDKTEASSSYKAVPDTVASRARQQPLFLRTYSEGDWVIVAYDNHWSPGIVEKATSQSLLVNFMARAGNNRFYWPERADRQQVEASGIMYYLKSPPEPVSTRHMVIPELKYIDFIFSST